MCKFLLALVCIAGCSRGHAPASTESAQSAPAPAKSLDRARGLALLAPAEESPVDVEIKKLEDNARANPASADVWVALGRDWVKKARATADPGYYLNADACVEMALDAQPGAPMALDLRGLVLLSDHRFAEARDLAESVIAARPEDPMAYGTLSDAELELGKFEEAARAAQKMVDLKPNLPSYSRAAYLRWLQGDAKVAKETWRLAIDAAGSSRDPEPRAWALVEAAMVFWHEGDYEGAEAGFDAALQAMESYPPALVGKGRVALARGDGKRAAELLARAHRASPLVETAWLLGDARAMAGDAKGAAEAYDLVVKRGRRADRRTLAQFLAAKERDADEAVKLAEEELAGRGDVYTHDAHAFALYRAGRLAEARAESDVATRLGTKDARLLFHAGAIRIAQGETDAGRALVEKALALNPKFDVAGAAEAARLLGRK